MDSHEKQNVIFIVIIIIKLSYIITTTLGIYYFAFANWLARCC